jgi:hypothetical protein
MDAIPTRTTARGAIHVVAFLALALASRPGHADQAGRIASLQALGTQIKLARDLALSGHAPDSTKLAHFGRNWRIGQCEHGSRSTFRAQACIDTASARRPRRLAGAFVRASPGPATRADIEWKRYRRPRRFLRVRVGISQTMPVRVTLGAAGGGRRTDVWLRFEPPAPVAIDSKPAAPARSASRSSADVRRLLSPRDDDTSGLDVAIATSAEDRSRS